MDEKTREALDVVDRASFLQAGAASVSIVEKYNALLAAARILASNEAFIRFIREHSATVGAALGLYSRHMTEAASEAQAGYDAIKDDPVRRAAQDDSLMSTNGLRMSAEMFREAARKADAAFEAFTRLAEDAGDRG